MAVYICRTCCTFYWSQRAKSSRCFAREDIPFIRQVSHWYSRCLVTYTITQTRSTDLHLILNLIKSSPGLQKATTWLPLCLPKFNANGFVYALVDFPRPDLGIVFVSADKEAYEGLQRWKASVFEVGLLVDSRVE